MQNLEEYYLALERLIGNRPINLPKGTKISKDSVALEAGRKRGAIRNDRGDDFKRLISKINSASKKQKEYQDINKDKILKLKNDIKKITKDYHNALNREIMYLETINELEKRLKEKLEYSSMQINLNDYRNN